MMTFVTEKVDADLAFLWQDKEIELIHQYRLAKRKITSVSRFASLEEDLERFKLLMVKACEIPPDDEIARAVTLADLVTAWSAARSLNAAELEVKAAASAAPSSAPPFIPTRTYNIMAASFREAHGKKTDDELPGEPFMAGQMKKVENNTPKAEQLSEVTSVEDGEDEVTYAECGVTGVLKAHTRKVKKVPAPSTPGKAPQVLQGT